jgi:rhomboid protease GluP
MEQNKAEEVEQGRAAGDFYSSGKSHLAKARRWLWVGTAFGVAISVLNAKGSIGTIAFSAGFVILLAVAIDLIFRRQLKTGKPLVSITDEAIESSILTSKEKRYRWTDIVGASVEAQQGVPRLELRLSETLGVSDKRSFWSGTNHARPSIPLGSFAPEEQERLLQAVGLRLQQGSSVSESNGPALHDAIAEDREFQDRLKSFAPITWVLWAIVGINVLVWLATAMGGGNVMQNSADKLLHWGGNAASEVQRGDWWRLLTATFLHGGVMHLVMNMIGLISAGVTVERIYGHRLFLLIYFGSGLLGSALSLHFSAQHAVSVGASGAVFGVTGALLVGVFQHRDKLPKAFGKQTISSLGIFIVYALMQGFAKQGIDNAAHVGGLIGGCLLAYLLPERFDLAHFARHFKARAITGVALVLVATAGVAAMAPRAAIDQKRLFESQGLFARGIASFESALKALQQEADSVKAQRMTERESDERSRSVHAPSFRRVLGELAAVYLRPGDPREPLLKEVKRMTELFLESLEMQSVYQEGSDKPEPIDPQRMAAIERELKGVNTRLTKLLEEVKTKQNR